MIIERPAIFTLTDTQHIKGFSYRFGFGTATGHFRLPLFRITQVDNQCALSRSSNIYRNITCLPAKGKIFSALYKTYRSFYSGILIRIRLFRPGRIVI